MEYSLTTYNIFKLHLPYSRQYIGILEKNTTFLLLQEWIDSLTIAEEKHIVTQETFKLPLKNSTTGIAIISSYEAQSVKKYISTSKELGFLTPKSGVVATYHIKNKPITIGNCHALNFVTNKAWRTMIDAWLHTIPRNGACIVAGDFNTWNPWRFDYLEKKLGELGFTYAHYEHTLVILLDHIWYRDVEKVSCTSNLNVHVSDHYPVTFTFKLQSYN
jgi:endonuclease/exonuclease/phosphatase (EEP) superfamily protein YafD